MPSPSLWVFESAWVCMPVTVVYLQVTMVPVYLTNVSCDCGSGLRGVAQKICLRAQPGSACPGLHAQLSLAVLMVLPPRPQIADQSRMTSVA